MAVRACRCAACACRVAAGNHPKAVLLDRFYCRCLAGANAYLGLFAGMTVSASIPAAVVSMAVLRLFRQSNILENNIANRRLFG